MSAGNPYVGPRAFTTGEALFGRARERAALLDLLVAERVVLLHAASGAGKSSLLYAGLIPDLRAEGFRVRPPIRVGAEPPASAPAGVNRFVLAALQSLEEGVPAAQQRSLATLATLDLVGYLGAEPDEAEVLIFDQFEEVLTLESIGFAAKHAFFAVLGAALRSPQRWAVFAIREDHLAGLAPYQRAVPTRLKTTFHLGLLSAEAALAAVQLPARARGVEFTDAAARKLVDDLRQVQLPGPDGALMRVPGPHVEPVQLQVTCRNLWERKPADDVTIDEQDVQAIGDVDQALAGYYDDQIAAVAGAGGVRESEIRAWFDRALISEQGLRGQVLQGASDSQGLANAVIRRLVDTHLVRAEQRRGVIWFELAHDRLIGPVRASNARWAAEHLGPAERQAQLWDSQGRPESLLFADLAEIDRLLARPQIAALERVFLEQSRLHRRRERSNRRLRRIVVASSICALLAIVVTLGALVALYEFRSVGAEEARARAEAQAAAAERATQVAQEVARVALSRQLAGNVLLTPPERPDLAALSALAASALTHEWEARGHLRNLVARAPQLLGSLPGTRAPRELALDPTRERLAGLDREGQLHVWDLRAHGLLQTTRRFIGHEALVFDATRGEFVTADRDGDVTFHGAPGRVLEIGDIPLRALASSSDGTRLATAAYAGEVAVWDAASGASLARRALIDPADRATPIELALDARGDTLALAGPGGALSRWRWADEEPRRLELAGLPGAPIGAVGFTGDGALRSLHADGRLIAWSDAGAATVLAGLAKNLAPTEDDDARPLALGLSADATHAAAIVCHVACTQEALVVWDAASARSDAVSVHLGERDPEGRLLATVVTDDRVVVAGTHVDARVWTTRSWRPLPGSPTEARAVAVSSDGGLFAAGGCSVAEDCQPYTVAVWRSGAATPVHAALAGMSEPPVALAFFAGDARLAGFGRDGQVVFWDMSSGTAEQAPRLPAEPDALAVRAADRGLVVALAEAHGVILWDVLADRLVPVKFTDEVLPQTAVALDPGGRWLAAGGCAQAGEQGCARGSLQLWPITGGAPVAALELHAGEITALVFSPAGDRLISIAADGSVLVSEVVDGLQRPRGLGDETVIAQDAAYARDGLAIATVGCVPGRCGPAEAEIRLWTADTLEPLGAATRGHSPLARDGLQLPRHVAFAASDATLLTTSADGIVAWDIGVAGMRARACELAGRELIEAEWSRKLGTMLAIPPPCPLP